MQTEETNNTSDTTSNPDYTTDWKEDRVKAFKKRTAESASRRFLSLSYFDNHIPDDALFEVLSDDSLLAKQEYINEAIDTYYDQLLLDHLESRKDALKDTYDKLSTYLTLSESLSTELLSRKITTLENKNLEKIKDFHKQLQNDPNIQKKGISNVRAFNAYINTANPIRFNFLWLVSALKSTLDPNSAAPWFKAFNDFSLFPGSASFLFYFPRGLGLLANRLKHIVKSHYWMTKEEIEFCEHGDISFFERFLAQMNMDKYALLNDLVWGPANMACFLWYNSFYVYHFMGIIIRVGSKLKSAAEWGNILTVALFGMDLLSSISSYIEAENTHQKNINKLTEQMQKPENKARQTEFRNRIAEAELKHKYAQARSKTDICYALCLLTGFAIMVAVMSNPFTAIPATIVGASMCWSGNLVKDLTKNLINLEEAQETLWLMSEASKELVTKYGEINNSSKYNDVEKSKILNAIIKQHQDLETKFYKQENHLTVLKHKLWFNTAVDLTLPVALWTTMMFCPYTLGAAIVAATLVVVYAAYQALIRYDERCTEDCEIVTDEKHMTTNKAYIINKDNNTVSYVNNITGEMITYCNDEAKAIITATQCSFAQSFLKFIIAIITLAPIFSNVDALADELSKFSSERKLTAEQIKEIESTIKSVEIKADKDTNSLSTSNSTNSLASNISDKTTPTQQPELKKLEYKHSSLFGKKNTESDNQNNPYHYENNFKVNQ